MLNLKDIPVANFPDGHKHLIVPDDFGHQEEVCLVASIRNFDDLFLIAQAKEIFPDLTELYINYLLAARADRVFSLGEAFDLAIVGDFINTLQFEKVFVLRPHSSVAGELIHNMEELDVTPALLRECEKEFPDGKEVGLVIPDQGASSWAYDFVTPGYVPVQCEKQRDMSGEHRAVSRIVIPDLPEGVEDYVIVDDLCDGGGTFLGIGQSLREKGAKRVFLVVTHAILSKGPEVFNGIIDRIYCTNSFADFKHQNIFQLEV
jgi:ribose-phosphate pyrophosphokinase